LEVVGIPSRSLLVQWALLHLVDLQPDLVEASEVASEVAFKIEEAVAASVVAVAVAASRTEEVMAAEVV